MNDRVGPGGGRVRVFFMDEARPGQQGTLTDVWARRGSGPTAVRQTRYEWVYLYAAVEPATGASAALLAPNADTGTMNAFLRILAAERTPGERLVLVMDGAGWHTSRALRVPEGIEVLILPPDSPELNPVENLWHYLRSHYLGNPGVRRLRRAARRRHRGVPQAHARPAQDRLRLPLPDARGSILIRIRAQYARAGRPCYNCAVWHAGAPTDLRPWLRCWFERVRAKSARSFALNGSCY